MTRTRTTNTLRLAPALALAASALLSGPAVPAAQARDYKWGAIYVDTTKKKGEDFTYGIGGGDTEEEAKANALKFCSEDGAKSCKLNTTYQGCGAVASDEKSLYGGYGETEADAKAAAMKSCTGGASCKVVASDCN